MDTETSRWFNSWESLTSDYRNLRRGDIVVIDHGFFKHYVVINREIQHGDYEVVQLRHCGKHPRQLERCTKPRGPSHNQFEKELLSIAAGEFKVRLDNQYPFAPGAKKRIDFLFKLGYEPSMAINCEAFANMIRSDIIPEVSMTSLVPLTSARQLPFREVPRKDTLETAWYDSWEDMIKQHTLSIMDIIAFDRGTYKHFAVVIAAAHDDYLCIDLQKSDAIKSCTSWCCSQSVQSVTTSGPTKEGEVRKVRLSEIASTGEQGSGSIHAIESGSRIGRKVSKCTSKVKICNKFPLEDGWEERWNNLMEKSDNILYNVFKFNCEHFANFIRSDKWVSDQVKDGLLMAGGIGLAGAIGLGALAVGCLLGNSEDQKRKEERERREMIRMFNNMLN